MVRLADIVLIAGSGIFAFWLRNDVYQFPALLGMAVGFGVLTHIIGAQLIRLYDFATIRKFTFQLGRISFLWTLVVAFLIALAYFTKTSEDFSRIWAATWFFSAYIGLILVRIVVTRKIDARRASGELVTRIAVIGTGQRALRLKQLQETPWGHDWALAGFYHIENETGVPVLSSSGGLNELIRDCEQGKVDEIVLAIEGDETGMETTHILEALSGLSLDIKIAPYTVNLSIPVFGLSYIGGAALLNVQKTTLHSWGRAFKRLEDLVIGIACLVLLSPVMALIAALIKLTSRGPVFFCQERLGFHNNAFTLYKFRTMYDRPGEDAGGGALHQAVQNDPRVTPLGRILRRTSLDELPQLFNVIRGEMSLVGPRPHAVSHDREYAKIINGYIARHRVKPGMTGWAQVNGFRGETDTLAKMRIRVEHDLYYIENWSLWFDLKILLLTLIFGFVQKNAY